ncbi:MAG: serine acetyltransferase [Lachnospiraceae bacterium]|nr:serine acetyltransferase [Lachnospiraceae bacterium]
MNEKHLELLNALNEVRDTLPGGAENAPSRTRIISILKQIMVVLLPEYYQYRGMSQAEALASFEGELVSEIADAMALQNAVEKDPALGGDLETTAETLAEQFVAALPEVKRLILTDIQAIYEGDPAAKSKAEVVLCYPGFFAISIYRVAHVLYKLGVPLIPRIMTEYAHEKTGVDIHPGATIGEYFCIDHGTGVVVGETSTIGQHVKLYQGVTIGAKSFERDAEGKLVKGGKRHPDIGDYVVIYANATILGGTTRIGDHVTIGGSAWITFSVGAGETVLR